VIERPLGARASRVATHVPPPAAPSWSPRIDADDVDGDSRDHHRADDGYGNCSSSVVCCAIRLIASRTRGIVVDPHATGRSAIDAVVLRRP